MNLYDKTGVIGPIGVSGGILIAVAARDDSLRDVVRDLEYIAAKAFPGKTTEESLLNVADFIAGYQAMWRELGNLYPGGQSYGYVGREPLFTDSSCEHLNPKVSPKDYLLMFKDFLRKWAYHMHTGNEIRDWYEAKDSYS